MGLFEKSCMFKAFLTLEMNSTILKSLFRSKKGGITGVREMEREMREVGGREMYKCIRLRMREGVRYALV